MESFNTMLSGGHPNSLGRTTEVVAICLEQKERLGDLFACYSDDDPVVRLRTSSAFKRIFREHPSWFRPWVNRLMKKVATLKQPSAEWTYAQLCSELDDQLTAVQRKKSIALCKQFLDESDDWIVLNHSMQALVIWAIDNPALKRWLTPRLKKLQAEPRKSIARRATKAAKQLGISLVRLAPPTRR